MTSTFPPPVMTTAMGVNMRTAGEAAALNSTAIRPQEDSRPRAVAGAWNVPATEHLLAVVAAQDAPSMLGRLGQPEQGGKAISAGDLRRPVEPAVTQRHPAPRQP